MASFSRWRHICDGTGFAQIHVGSTERVLSEEEDQTTTMLSERYKKYRQVVLFLPNFLVPEESIARCSTREEALGALQTHLAATWTVSHTAHQADAARPYKWVLGNPLGEGIPGHSRIDGHAFDCDAVEDIMINTSQAVSVIFRRGLFENSLPSRGQHCIAHDLSSRVYLCATLRSSPPTLCITPLANNDELHITERRIVYRDAVVRWLQATTFDVLECGRVVRYSHGMAAPLML